MRNVLVLVVVGIFGTVVLADEWIAPTETDYPSDNGRYIAHVTPGRGIPKARLDVFELQGSERVLQWSCELANEVTPVEVYISDDGRCVTTCNEWHRVGYGDSVLVFYGKQGLIARYSMEQVLHLPPDMTRLDLRDLIPHSVSSRWWDENSIKFFDGPGGALRFCIWLHLFDRWLVWDPSTGQEIVEDDVVMIQRYNAKARQWALEQIKTGQGYHCPYEFLGKLQKPEDRPLIASLLSDARFDGQGWRSVQLPSSGADPAKSRLELYRASSLYRSLGERILMQWDQKNGEPETPRLGIVEGTVNLPHTADPREATLWVYLIPITVAKDQWQTAAPVQWLLAPYGNISFDRYDIAYTEVFPFAISTVTPGQYWIKAVLDKTQPPTEMTDQSCTRQNGDYENLDYPVVTIVAGETAHVSIDCTHLVTEAAD